MNVTSRVCAQCWRVLKRSGQDNAVTNMKHRFEIQRKTALASVLIALVSSVSSTAQTLTLLAEFGRLPDLAGMNPQFQPVQGSDGTGYAVLKHFVQVPGDGLVPRGGWSGTGNPPEESATMRASKSP